MADDRMAGVNAITSTTFDIISTPTALLRDAPPLAPPFRREDVLQPALIDTIIAGIKPAVPSSALTSAINAARQGHFVDLVREDAVTAEEQGARALLRTLALYALGDTPTSLAVSLRQAATASAPPAALQVVLGATRALEGSDRDAIAAWQAAMAAGFDAPTVPGLLVDAYLRLGDTGHAIELATGGLERQPGDAALTRRLAAAHIAANRMDEAVRVLDGHLRASADDADAQWLLLQALFTGPHARRAPAPIRPDAIASRPWRLVTQQAGGKNAALAAEWAASVK